MIRTKAPECKKNLFSPLLFKMTFTQSKWFKLFFGSTQHYSVSSLFLGGRKNALRHFMKYDIEIVKVHFRKICNIMGNISKIYDKIYEIMPSMLKIKVYISSLIFSIRCYGFCFCTNYSMRWKLKMLHLKSRFGSFPHTMLVGAQAAEIFRWCN